MDDDGGARKLITGVEAEDLAVMSDDQLIEMKKRYSHKNSMDNYENNKKKYNFFIKNNGKEKGKSNYKTWKKTRS